ncbi:hypothetical protein CLV59_108211 [Chitinophaga dinghuensis]|uniref:PIN domain-containing protein n=1 Tax=Chitinophaga dinghuensis TaxID=1539050 RepID=A0A327VMZ5_9BACT|nr:hypothetical protein [Chitinophaga dinghuensis]RAJ76691.1 hypothetical protein CLV59_108211 [Chitinophaga dinghuensis]
MSIPPIFYFDLNVFNKIEKIDTLEGAEKEFYQKLEQMAVKGDILVPYSNAHMRDLVRGYQKSKEYIDGHLATIGRITQNLCVTQYWNESKVRWHQRDVKDFFQDTLEDAPINSFYNLYKGIDDDNPLMQMAIRAHQSRCELMKLQPINPIFKQIYKEDPIFGHIYPLTRENMNLFSLNEDLLNFSQNVKTDFVLYKNFRKYLGTLRQKFPQLVKEYGVTDIFQKISTLNPAHLTWEGIWDDLSSKYKPSSNPDMDRMFDLFVKTDFNGYKQDERFANLVDDALHTCYGAHCNVFVTNDNRCFEKAKVVYKKFAPHVHLIKPGDILALMKTNNSVKE